MPPQELLCQVILPEKAGLGQSALDAQRGSRAPADDLAGEEVEDGG